MTGGRAALESAPGASICVIFNPVAGTRRGDDVASFFRSGADRGAVDIRETKAPGHATELAATAARDGYRIVVAVGGDGTVNEVAQGLFGTRTALGIVPRGSGNGLARHLKISLDPATAAAALRTPSFQRIDVGRINGRPFLCTAGIGFDAHIARHFALARRRGLATYVSVALRRYLTYRSTPIEARLGDTRLRRDCYLLAFANASQYGNDAFIAPHADLEDGVLDLCLIDKLPLWRAVRVGRALMRGTLPASGAAEFHTGADILVRAERPTEFHVDGEFAGEAREFEVRLTPLELQVAT